MSVKVGIPVLYFSSVGVLWTPYDGQKFQRLATGLLHEGITPWSFLLDLEFVSGYVDSTHVLPYWLNVTGQYFFGPHYFSAIFVNIFATIITGIYAMFILSQTGFRESYYKYFLMFFMIHWDVLVYSSLVNMKGVIITLLIVMYLYHNIMLSTSQRLLSVYHVTVMGVILLIIYWSRFYIIFILGVASVMWVIIESDPKQWIPITAITTVGLYPIIRIGLQFQDTRYFQLDFWYILYSVPRTLLTPRPWGVLPHFAFLIPPSIFHWLLIIPAIAYSCRLWVQHKNMRLLLCYLFVFVMFYSVFYQLASARMRYQIAFVFAIGQYHFFWSLSQAVSLTGVPEIALKHI